MNDQKDQLLQPYWPHCLALDPGFEHPTGAVMGTVSPNGHYHLVSFYREAQKKMWQHATALLRIVDRSKQRGRRTFFSKLTDRRDPQFSEEVRYHTKGIIMPSPQTLPKDTSSPWSVNDLKLASIRKVLRLRAEGKLHANVEDPYYYAFEEEWAKYRWDPGRKFMEVPLKIEDDVMDAITTCIWNLHPSREILQPMIFDETHEPPLKQLIKEHSETETETEPLFLTHEKDSNQWT